MLAFIGGTGLTRMDGLTVIHRHNIDTEWGEPSAAVVEGELAGKRVLFLARHGDPHVLLPHQVNYRANVAALKQAGASEIVAVNAVGGITARAPTAAIVVPDQIIDYSYGRETTYFDKRIAPVVHVDFSWPFAPSLRQRLLSALSKVDAQAINGGCYGATQGPRLETAAEISRMESDGCDIVGMTGMPEAVLARELELPYAMLSLVVNPGAGKSDREITMEEIEAVIHAGMGKVCEALTALVADA
ncbi:MAG: 5'-methylthioadenosine phosphorylase [Gammaproteobacteria bacterium HGW-Gammaproteobacteria-14]|nr:MAG: 5'-methylthioadenosine phosphorylase [Gammaproteobacteria bacterium HGW-Gammaproteobacteria-14]